MEDVELMLYGPEVYERVNWEDRPRFDAEWSEILRRAGLGLELAPIVEMLCRWWIATGGDVEHAAAVRAEFAERSRARRWGGNNLSGDVVCECTGPAIYEALPRELAAAYADRMTQAAAEAIVTHDWRPLWVITLDSYIETQATDADRAVLAEQLAEITAALEAGTLVGSTRDDA